MQDLVFILFSFYLLFLHQNLMFSFHQKEHFSFSLLLPKLCLDHFCQFFSWDVTFSLSGNILDVSAWKTRRKSIRKPCWTICIMKSLKSSFCVFLEPTNCQKQVSNLNTDTHSKRHQVYSFKSSRKYFCHENSLDSSRLICKITHL